MIEFEKHVEKLLLQKKELKEVFNSEICCTKTYQKICQNPSSIVDENQVALINKVKELHDILFSPKTYNVNFYEKNRDYKEEYEIVDKLIKEIKKLVDKIDWR